jgi:O-antigen/teichoic acid export membrane protein
MFKKLISQTAIYGLSSMLGRFINFLLVIPHTKYLKTVNDYGDITSVFAFMAFLNILLSYGMETSFFYFIRNGNEPKKVFAITQKSLIFSTLLFALLAIVFSSAFSSAMGFDNQKEIVYCCLIFLTFDTLSILPFAKLRFEEKPFKFAGVKLINILVNVGLNLYFLITPPEFLANTSQVVQILIANAIASLCSFLILSKSAFSINSKFDFTLYKKILSYAWPLIFVGLAGMVNETLDRTMIKHLIPGPKGSYENGIYGAFYKLTMVMTMFVQAYRFAAEPLFFKQKESIDSRQMYSDVMYWFVGVCAIIFLTCMLFIEPLSHLFIKDQNYFADPNGLKSVPILLMANLFLGIYYNLSIWYRFTNNTKKGALIASIGAVITLIFNFIFIPIYGFIACAWTTLGVYFTMSVISYIWGRKHYPIPYHIARYLTVIATSVLLWFLDLKITYQLDNVYLRFFVQFAWISLMLLIIWVLQPKRKKH